MRVQNKFRSGLVTRYCFQFVQYILELYRDNLSAFQLLFLIYIFHCKILEGVFLHFDPTLQLNYNSVFEKHIRIKAMSLFH